jgi:hypothetical protein
LEEWVSPTLVKLHQGEMPGLLYKVSLRQLAETANHKRQVPQIPG